MTNRERFAAAMAFQPTDRLCHLEWSIWSEAFENWKKQGLPEHVALKNHFNRDSAGPGTDLFEWLDVIQEETLSLNEFFYPGFGYNVIDETEDYVTVRNNNGVLMRQNKKILTIPEYIDYPIKNKKDYYGLKDRLFENLQSRYPQNWDDIAQFVKNQQQNLVRIYFHGFFGFPREIMGLVQFLYNLYDDPEFIKEMLDDRLNFFMRLYEKAIIDARPDFVFVWEDMCFKNGPLMSPEMFKEFLLPNYKKLTAYLRDMGVKNILVDSDGDVRRLIPLWIEGGITGLLPFEVRAGMDVVQLAQEYPRLQILGGIDKTELEKGRSGVDSELDRVLPFMAKRGGYCAALDHHIHVQIDLDTFRYYTQRIAEFNQGGIFDKSIS